MVHCLLLGTLTTAYSVWVLVLAAQDSGLSLWLTVEYHTPLVFIEPFLSQCSWAGLGGWLSVCVSLLEYLFLHTGMLIFHLECRDNDRGSARVLVRLHASLPIPRGLWLPGQLPHALRPVPLHSILGCSAFPQSSQGGSVQWALGTEGSSSLSELVCVKQQVSEQEIHGREMADPDLCPCALFTSIFPLVCLSDKQEEREGGNCAAQLQAQRWC